MHVMTIKRTEPATNADEWSTLEGFLDYHRQTLEMKCAGLDDDQLRTASVPPSELSLMGLVRQTTTTATLLVTVAVSALSGCVTIQHPPAPGVPAAPPQPSTPHPDGRAGPHIVQAPAKEALERVAPPRTPTPDASAGPKAAASAPAAAPAATPHHPRRTPPAHTEPRLPAPRVAAPPDLRRPPPRTTEVCAHGRNYGGWEKDSPEAVICQDVYGR